MKIGVLTQPLRSNYGGILQAYALQQTLIRLGYNPIVLNRNFDYPSFRLFLLRCVSVVKCVFRKYALGKRNIRISNPLSTHYTIYKDEYYDNVELRRFTKHHIKRTCVLRSSKLLKLYVRFSGLCCFIVGSDQVWREAYSPCITDYFLHFLPKGKKYKKISYAASFGIKETDISKDKLALCAEDLKSFNAISVRERTGVDIVNTISGMNATLVLDPTLLLKAEDYSVLSIIFRKCILGNPPDSIWVCRILISVFGIYHHKITIWTFRCTSLCCQIMITPWSIWKIRCCVIFSG